MNPPEPAEIEALWSTLAGRLRWARKRLYQERANAAAAANVIAAERGQGGAISAHEHWAFEEGWDAPTPRQAQVLAVALGVREAFLVEGRTRPVPPAVAVHLDAQDPESAQATYLRIATSSRNPFAGIYDDEGNPVAPLETSTQPRRRR